MTSSLEPTFYTERLRVPFSYWAIALFFGLSFVTAVSFMLGDAVFVASTGTATVLIAWTLLAWGSLTITVDAGGVRVGASRLDWAYVGQAAAVDQQQRRRVLAREDVHLALRPYVSGVVVIGVADRADPHLCWLVSTRDPDELVRAIERNRPSGAGEQAEQTALDSGA
ncbi:DUF3093 domain-containing protein [Micropruina sp.]|uniref:DUF3093 domain-containing protein n=1 Tax=Micropruina sp. TaxID=2737536 RepID=UPI0039E56596